MKRNEKSLKFVLCYNSAKNFAKRKNHVGGNISQMMRIISNERENLNRLLPVLLRTIFQIFNTISSGEKMGAGGERGSFNQALRKEGAWCVNYIVIMEEGGKFYFKRLSI